MRWYGGDLGDWVEIPHMRDNDVDLDRAGARALGIAESDYLAFGLRGR